MYDLKQQRGFATIAVVLVVLLSLSIITLFTAKSLISEQRVGSNSVRGEQAFSSAQAGLNYAINYLQDNRTTVTNGQVVNGTLPSGAQFSAKLEFLGSNNLVKVISTGTSSDGATSRMVAQITKYKMISSGTPPVPMQSRVVAYLQDTSSITNLHGDKTIITGDNVTTFAGSAQTVLSSGVSSNSSGTGADVDQNNATLAGMNDNDFQLHVFGKTLNDMVPDSSVAYLASRTVNFSPYVNGVTGTQITLYQTGGYAIIDGNTIAGSSAQPLTLLVSGNIIIRGNAVFNGHILATGSVIISGDAKVNGLVFTLGSVQLDTRGQVHGAAIAGNQYASWQDSSLYYEPSNLTGIGVSSGEYGRVFGSWQDMGN